MQLKKASDVKGKVANIADQDHYLTKTNVITEDGTQLGSISDIYFDSVSGDVQEFEVSQGLLQNVKSGKKRFKINDIITVGEHATIVKSYVEVIVEEQGSEQGLDGIVNKGKEKAKSAIETAKDKASEMKSTMQEKTNEIIDKTKEVANRPEVQEKKDAFINKAGELKDNTVDKFNQVKEEAKSGELKDKITDKASELKEKTQNKFEEVKENNGQKIDEVKNNAEDKKIDLKQNMPQVSSQDPKKMVIGKYLTQTIITPENLMIASRGDVITEALVRVAEAQGVLDLVLNNVSETPIEI